MTLQSAFSNTLLIPQKYCKPGVENGENISPPLSWTEIPRKTTMLILAIIDVHPIANNWIHWLVTNIDTKSDSIEEGASMNNMPKGSIEHRNSYGQIGYGGPQPPIGSGKHTYEIHLFALKSTEIEVDDNPTWAEIQETIQGNVVEEAVVMGHFER